MSVRFVAILALFVGLGFGLARWMSGPKAPVASPSVDAAVEQSVPSVSQSEDSIQLPQARRPVAPPRIERAAEGQFAQQFAEVEALIRAGRAADAMRLLEGMLAKDPRHERALEEMGMLYLTEYQDSDKAAQYFRRALEVNPNNEFAVMELVGASLQPEKAGAAIDYLKKLYDANPQSSVLADGLGELYLTQGRFQEAVAFLERSAQDTRYSEFAYTRLASVYEQTGDTDKAAEYYRRAISHQRGELDRRRGEGQSVELLETDLARSQLDLAHLLVREGKFEEAEDIVDQAEDRLGSDWEVQALRDQIRSRAGG